MRHVEHIKVFNRIWRSVRNRAPLYDVAFTRDDAHRNECSDCRVHLFLLLDEWQSDEQTKITANVAVIFFVRKVAV